ncbi:unnamed protein product [Amoebophrya sp. A25]|nr:unnamed protein product [Amoebophrya sp. A25]|eukprot:GSA25T00027455001.1
MSTVLGYRPRSAVSLRRGLSPVDALPWSLVLMCQGVPHFTSQMALGADVCVDGAYCSGYSHGCNDGFCLTAAGRCMECPCVVDDEQRSRWEREQGLVDVRVIEGVAPVQQGAQQAEAFVEVSWSAESSEETGEETSEEGEERSEDDAETEANGSAQQQEHSGTSRTDDAPSRTSGGQRSGGGYKIAFGSPCFGVIPPGTVCDAFKVVAAPYSMQSSDYVASGGPKLAGDVTEGSTSNIVSRSDVIVRERSGSVLRCVAGRWQPTSRLASNTVQIPSYNSHSQVHFAAPDTDTGGMRDM